MKRFIVLIMPILFFTGCTQVSVEEAMEEPFMPESVYEVVRGKLVVELSGEEVGSGGWIDPSKVVLKNLGNGEPLIVPIKVYNSSDQLKVFVVGLREPDFTEQGYRRLEDGDSIWIVVSHQVLEVLPGGVGKFMVIAGSIGDKVSQRETWVSVKEDTLADVGLEWVVRILIE